MNVMDLYKAERNRRLKSFSLALSELEDQVSEMQFKQRQERERVLDRCRLYKNKGLFWLV